MTASFIQIQQDAMNSQFGRLQNKSARYGSPCFHLLAIGLLVSTCVLLCGTNTAVSQDPHWIWSPDHDKTAVPRGTCYFRKTIKIANPERGTIAIAADDQYVLYVNGTVSYTHLTLPTKA